MFPDLIDELSWRGLLHQSTDEARLRAHLAAADRSAGGRRIYIGFDPTADSLTIGNLVPIMVLVHVQRAGHTPVVVMGGGTGLIGDPSGKSAERLLQTEDAVRHNVERQKRIFTTFLRFEERAPSSAHLVNNLDWLAPLGYIQVLRDVGKFFSVNEMVKRDSVRSRLEERDQGISYTEFSYMILQAYDFLHLFRSLGVTVQGGGSDQWGNIVAGVDLIRKADAGEGAARSTGARAHHAEGHDVHGMTCPLVTKADGTKFGKTESGAVWLTADRTSPYAYYQFWLNADDRDVGRFLRTFTLLPRDEIETIEASHAGDPGQRLAQRALAQQATDLLHGRAERENAERAAAALFRGEVRDLPLDVLEEALRAAPSSVHSKNRLEGEGLSLVELLPETTLAASKSQARQSLQEGAVSVNGDKASPDSRLTTRDLLHGRVIALRRGKKNWHVTRWE